MINPADASSLYESRFLSLCREAGGTNHYMARRWYEALMSAYENQAFRHFHDEKWLGRTLRNLDDIISYEAFELPRPEIVFLAVYFCRFRLRPDQSEFDNQMECLKAAADFMRDIDCDSTAMKLLINTISSIPNGTTASATPYWFFNDAMHDWYSETNDVYRKCVKLLRAEANHMDDTQFIRWRLGTIKTLLGRKRIYYTDNYSGHLEQIARGNMDWEQKLYHEVLEELRKQGASDEIPIPLPAGS
jgi:predicted metal-dependent HD superfamily phosphohydrolase